MKLEVDTHAHTLVSGHAYNTIYEMAETAAQKGLKGLALTEHAPDMPGTTHEYYFHNLKIVPRQMCGIELLLGTELNILNETGKVDLSKTVLEQMDITIASIHVPCYKGDTSKEAVTDAYLNTMKNDYVDIIGHPDDGRYISDYNALAAFAKETGTLLELNNASLSPDCFREECRDNATEMLEYCKKHGTMIVVGTDAHVDARVGEFKYALELLEEVAFPEELVANTSLEKLKAFLKRNRL